MTTVQTLLSKHIKEIEVGGEKVRIRKLGADGYIKVRDYLASVPADEHNRPTKQEDGLTFAALIVSKSLLGDGDKLECDSDEGRSLLMELPIAQIQEISAECLLWSGLATPLEEPPKN